MKADIFFFVTTIAVVVVSVFLIVMLCYVTIAFRRIRILCEKVEENIDTANASVKELTTYIKESFLFTLLFSKKKKRKKHS